MSKRPWQTLVTLFFYQLLGEAAEHRLLEHIVPVHYDVTLKFDPYLFFLTDRFYGEVNIILHIFQETNQIQIHAKNLTQIEMCLMDANRSYALTYSNFTSDPVTDILRITSQQLLLPGLYVLSSTYAGVLRKTYPMNGLYESTYKSKSSGTQVLVTTLAHPTYARTIFPCFDQPDLKASFVLSLIYPKGYKVMSNNLEDQPKSISDGLEQVTFRPTPVMSTYLVAFIISHFTCDERQEGILYRVCSRPEAHSERKFALDISPKLIKYMENFTGISYNSSGISKIDLVAVPDLSVGAMENWGLITFTEPLLLWNEHESLAYKQKVGTTVAHEISHMWFGNLVTMKSWSEPFLNEGLARYFQYFAMAEVEPHWQLDKQFILASLHKALVADSVKTSLPLSSYVSTTKEISAKFDVITYDKGAAVIRMIAHAMGLGNFQQGLRYYLQQYKFKSTVPKNLWNSLQNFALLPYFVEEVVYNWILQAGYPVLNVRRNGTSVIITQERFLLEGTANTKWYVPITYTTSRGSNNVETQIWLSPSDNELTLKNVILDSKDWIILNNFQIGYYRVNYDKDRIQSALRSNLSLIDPISRAQIVDDAFNFAIAGKISFPQLFERISFLKDEMDYCPWYAAFKGFSSILPKIKNLDTEKKLTNYIIALMTRALYESRPFNGYDPKNHILALNFKMKSDWACKLDDLICVQNAKQFFLAYKNGINGVRDLKFSTFCTALRHSTCSEEDWNFLWNKFKESNLATDQETILAALGCTKNHTILKSFLGLAFNASSGIRIQDSLSVLLSVIKGSRNGTDIALQYFIDKYQQISDYYKNEDSIKTLIHKLGASFKEQHQVDKLCSFGSRVEISDGVRATIKETVKLAKSNLKWAKTMENEVAQYFGTGQQNFATTTQPKQLYIFVAFCCLITTYFTL